MTNFCPLCSTGVLSTPIDDIDLVECDSCDYKAYRPEDDTRDPAYERAQLSDEWDWLHGGGL